MVFSDKPPFHTITRLVVPHWLLALPFVIFPVLWLLLYARQVRQRRTEGHCRCCGYNLTGSTSGVCPECGAAFVRVTPALPPGH